jgi:hypothetical protein
MKLKRLHPRLIDQIESCRALPPVIALTALAYLDYLRKNEEECHKLNTPSYPYNKLVKERLESAFLWDRTPQGFDFWANISYLLPHS